MTVLDLIKPLLEEVQLRAQKYQHEQTPVANKIIDLTSEFTIAKNGLRQKNSRQLHQETYSALDPKYTVETPTYGESTDDRLHLIRITRSKEITLTLSYLITEDHINNGPNISRDTFLLSNSTHDKVYLKTQRNIPISPERHSYQQGYTVIFELIFPNMHQDIDTVDLIEIQSDGGTSFTLKNIKIT